MYAVSFVPEFDVRIHFLIIFTSLSMSIMPTSASAAESYDSDKGKATKTAALLASASRQLKWHHYDRAKELFEKIVSVDPASIPAHTRLAKTLLGLKQYNEACAEFTRAIELVQRNAADLGQELDLRRGRAEAGQLAGSYQKAADDYSWVIDHGGATESLFVHLATAQDALGQTQLAITSLDKALERNPGDAETYLHRALLYKHLNDKQAAFSDFAKAIKINPALSSWRASFYLDQGQSANAIDDYTRAIEVNNGGCKATELCNRAAVYANLDHHRKAISDLNQAIKLQPTNADYLACRGSSYFGVSDFKKAISDFHQAIEKAPQEAEYYYKRAEALAADGQKEAAIKDYDEAIKRNPDKAGMYLFRRAIAASDMNHHQQAIEDLTKAIALDNQEPNYWFNRAMEYKAIDNFKESEANLSKSIELRPSFATAYKYRAMVRAKLDDHFGALDDLKKSMQLYDGEGDKYGLAEVQRLMTRVSKTN